MASKEVNQELEDFKEQFIKGYIFPYMDRLLDLMNKVKKAETLEDVSAALAEEKIEIQKIIHQGKPSEDKKTDMP